MRILTYRDLNIKKAIKAQFERTVAMLGTGDFRAADVRKMRGGGGTLYRSRLNDSDRLLFRLGKWEGESCLLLLDVVYNHAYDRSRFLRGAMVDEAKLEPLAAPPPPDDAAVEPLVYVHPEVNHFHVLDRVLSLDPEQSDAYRLSPPVIIIGSAGSGKTVLALERLKDLSGKVLYVTLSPHLAENARDLYYAEAYENDRQEVDFLSFREFLETIHVPEGQAMTYPRFEEWFARHRTSCPIKDPHRLFEEFGGVIVGSRTDAPYLSREEYVELGIRQSIFLPEERDAVYSLFERYIRMMTDEKLWDLNFAAFESLPRCQPRYDYAVVDEVQDITIVQLHLILSALHQRHHFVLCGDSNQIVHPNFFSWAKVKSFFYTDKAGQRGRDIMRILDANYRNSPQVTELANRLLLLKNARFGSIDRESNYLVRCCCPRDGTVELLDDSAEGKRDLNTKTRRSARFAVLVMRSEDKAEARRFFDTPLVFSVQEAKGLEYDDILVYNVVSSNRDRFAEVAKDVEADELDATDLRYARSRDKTDKSLEAYKFYVNSLYVAITRAVRNLYIIEADRGHRILRLLGLTEVRRRSSAAKTESSREEWAREAKRLDQQGKKEQADAIRRSVLETQPVPWSVVTHATLPELQSEALDPDHFNKKAKDLLFDYAVTYGMPGFHGKLCELKYKRSRAPEKYVTQVFDTYARDCRGKRFDVLFQKVDRYGVDFRGPLNRTPLMMAAAAGNTPLVEELIQRGADAELRDNWGRTALQIAIFQASHVPEYASAHLGRLYELLAPPSIRIRVYDRLVKTDRNQIEFLLLNILLALLQDLVTSRSYWRPVGVRSADILDLLKHLPDRAVPPHRKKRPYISSALARNECQREGAGNREFLLRTGWGSYVLNPLTYVQVDDEWVSVYDLVALSEFAAQSESPRVKQFAAYVSNIRPAVERVLTGKTQLCANKARAGDRSVSRRGRRTSP